MAWRLSDVLEAVFVERSRPAPMAGPDVPIGRACVVASSDRHFVYHARMSTVADYVKRYYATVDTGDADATAVLFAATARYDRPGYPTLVGHQIGDFYRNERVIAGGAHSLAEIIAAEPRAAAHGTFKGKLKDGQEVTERFADFFVFDADGFIAERTTYFYRAAV